MSLSQSEGPTPLLQRIFPARLPPVVVLIAWLLVIHGAITVLQYLLRLFGPSASSWNSSPRTLQYYYSYIIFAAADCLCGITLLHAVWWARRATVAVLVIWLLYRVVTCIGLDTLLPFGNSVHLNLSLDISLLLTVLNMFTDVVIIYFLTLPHIAAAWPRQQDTPAQSGELFPSLHKALLSCSKAVGRLFPPALPAEVAYIALAMLVYASSGVVGSVSEFLHMMHTRRPDSLILQRISPAGLLTSIIMIVLAIAVIRLVPWALYGTIIILGGSFLLREAQYFSRFRLSPAMLYPSSPSFGGLMLQFFLVIPSLLTLAIQVYFLTRPKVMQVFGWEPVATGTPAKEVLEDWHEV